MMDNRTQGSCTSFRSATATSPLPSSAHVPASRRCGFAARLTRSLGGMICSRRLVSISMLTNTHSSVEHVLLRPEEPPLEPLDRLPRDAAPMTCRLRHFRVHSFDNVFGSSLSLIFNSSAESLVVLDFSDWQNFVPSSTPFPSNSPIVLFRSTRFLPYAFRFALMGSSGGQK